ncbi:hypothetical protein V498_08900, partial [Pseudogymnoascus sp. VKM F-4517 (FW-2822)]
MAGTTSAQYQHFVPQFLLKNFSHPYKPQNDGSKTSKRSKRKYDKGKYPGDTVVRNLNLTADLPVICETLRFYHDNPEGYDANDRELLHDYMAEKGYERPVDVWFHNLKTIMELHMDPEGKWLLDLPK